MGGLNSLSGLNNVSVDFRPTITTNVQKTGNENRLLPGADAVPENAPQPEKAEAKSVVRQLDVLLLNAASKSISADAAQNVKTVSESLRDKGILTQKQADKLQRLAADAAEKLKALDNFSGRELAKALMQDKKTGETVWSKGFFGLNSAAKAVKAAIEAQQTLSAELSEFNDDLALASEDVVDVDLQEKFTELQFQCDRRASEISSILFRMYDLAQKDVVNGAAADPQTKALLDATFKELMPREAIMMHGTAEAFETLNKHMSKQMRPLAEKLDAFTADPSKFLDKSALGALRRDMATMKNAIANVRVNGIEINHPGGNGNPPSVSRTEVDKSLLDAMEKILDEASHKIGYAISTAIGKARTAFLEEVGANLSPLDAPGKKPTGNQSNHALMFTLMTRKNELVQLLNKFATNKVPMSKFDEAFDKLAANYDRDLPYDLEQSLLNMDVDPTIARSVGRAVNRLHLVKAQFKEMMESTAKLDDADFGIAASDVRRIMLGEKGLSNVVNAKALGFKADDVDPATEGQNIVGSRLLGAGVGGTTYLLTAKSGKEFVFKPELDSRFGLDTLALSLGNAYVNTQKTANLNLATQDTAKALGCDDVVVKYSVGNHDGQFGVFMEKAKGYTGSDFFAKKKAGGDGIAPADILKTITDPDEQLKDVCSKVLGWGWKGEYEQRVSVDPGIVKNPNDGSVTIDLEKAKSPEIKMAIIKTLGMQSIALPEEIDKGFYDKLMEMDNDPAQKQAFLDTLKPRISPEALKATENRLNEAIAHAKNLNLDNKVYGDAQWRDPMHLNQMSGIKSKVAIKKSDGKTVEVDDKIDCVKDFGVRNCPSFYKRDFLNKMFAKPKE